MGAGTAILARAWREWAMAGPEEGTRPARPEPRIARALAPRLSPETGVHPAEEAGDNPADAVIVADCLAGQTEGFRILVERYQKRAFWAAYNLVGSPEEAEDVTQDAFARAFHNLAGFDPARRFFTWFYRIVTNLAIDRLRRKSVARAVGLEELGDTLAAGEEPGAPLVREETRRKVRAVLDQLPAKFKMVMVMRDLEGLTCKEIAPILGTSHATVRWRLHKARQMFRERWERFEVRREPR